MTLRTNHDEETRKVQFTGGSTYIVSLPKKWISDNQLKKGSWIRLRSEENGILTIFPPELIMERKIDEATIKIVLDEKTETITRKLVSAYLAGYNSIKIKADKQSMTVKQRHEMKSFVRRMLVGTEIVTDTSSMLSLQVLLSYPQLSVQNALRRMSIITVSMYKDAMTGFLTNDVAISKEVISNDNEVDRFDIYVTRLLRTALKNPRTLKDLKIDYTKDCLSYRLVTNYVERIADHAVNIAENALSIKCTLSQEMLLKIDKMSSRALKMFETAMESLFREDYNSADSIIENINEIRALEKEAVALSQTCPEHAANLRLIIESVRRTAEYSCDIAEIALNLTVDSVLK